VQVKIMSINEAYKKLVNPLMKLYKTGFSNNKKYLSVRNRIKISNNKKEK
jgi:hypothetical protein